MLRKFFFMHDVVVDSVSELIGEDVRQKCLHFEGRGEDHYKYHCFVYQYKKHVRIDARQTCRYMDNPALWQESALFLIWSLALRQNHMLIH